MTFPELLSQAQAIYDLSDEEIEKIGNKAKLETEIALSNNELNTAIYILRSWVHRHLNTSRDRGMSSSKATKFMEKKEAKWKLGNQ